MEATIVFNCPACKCTFEFDPVGENELVSCPICGNDFRTVKNGQTLKLDYLNLGKAVCFDVTPSVFPFEIELINQAK
jgi:Zn finger protein HypA/HybF involved in hydrogenase expression